MYLVLLAGLVAGEAWGPVAAAAAAAWAPEGVEEGAAAVAAVAALLPLLVVLLGAAGLRDGKSWASKPLEDCGSGQARSGVFGYEVLCVVQCVGAYCWVE